MSIRKGAIEVLLPLLHLVLAVVGVAAFLVFVAWFTSIAGPLVAAIVVIVMFVGYLFYDNSRGVKP
jgi:hypothetical protein